VQAARSGVQNIAEGSQESGTSRQAEMKLTNVARASLEELRLDYEDYLRQHSVEIWSPSHPALQRFRARRCSTVDDFQDWLKAELMYLQRHCGSSSGSEVVPDIHGTRSRAAEPGSRVGYPSTSAAQADAVLSLLNLCCHLLNRQSESQAATFEREGGFAERLYQRRSIRRRQ